MVLGSLKVAQRGNSYSLRSNFGVDLVAPRLSSIQYVGPPLRAQLKRWLTIIIRLGCCRLGIEGMSAARSQHVQLLVALPSLQALFPRLLIHWG